MKKRMIAAAVLFVLALPAVVGAVVHHRDGSQWVTVQAVVVDEPRLVGDIEPFVAALVEHDGDRVDTRVPAQARRGDPVTAYVDRDTGRLWRADGEGSPNRSAVATMLAAACGAAVVVALWCAAGYLRAVTPERTARR